ncbi:MAG TPA: rhamnan synthesis F family protein [Rhizobium sp.]|nr:rhamnan synthesis F family protein [Rhizobium sp.]
MSEVHVYTSFSFAYLSRARILAQSLRLANPSWTIWAVIVDLPPAGFCDTDWESDFDFILNPEVLFPDWKAFVFKHDIVEACTAVKGKAMQYILAGGAKKVVYLDPDIAVFHPLDDIATELETASVILTPHQVEPNESPSDFQDNEQISLKYGIYNLGFIAVKNDEIGNAVASWWSDCLYRACYDQIEDGIFTDQKYCDLIPALFDRVRIERRPGFNVASWNISRRNIRVTRNGDITANDDLLRFYHFTKINSDGEGMTTRFGAGNYSVFEIWNWYKRRLRALDHPDIPRRYWHYGCLEDGTPIPKRVRHFFRNNLEIMRFENPFSVSDGSFADLYRAKGPELIGDPTHSIAKDRVACVIHAFYPELLDEILSDLSEYRCPLKLFITAPAEKIDEVFSALRRYKFESRVLETENRGRDILPFLVALREILSEGFDLVLKLHTKRSKHIENGEKWRRELLSCFTKPRELAAAVELFRRRRDLGILGPGGHNVSLAGYMGSNEGQLDKLKERMRVSDLKTGSFGFIAGSVFMARPAALQTLYELNLQPGEFEAESSQTDGTLAHAIERAWTFSACARLLKVATKPIETGSGEVEISESVAELYEFAPRSHHVLAE